MGAKRRSNARHALVGTGHINTDVSFFIYFGVCEMKRQLRLWDVRRFEESTPTGKNIVLVWVAYNGKVVNRETFIFVRKDRNGKSKAINESS